MKQLNETVEKRKNTFLVRKQLSIEQYIENRLSRTN